MNFFAELPSQAKALIGGLLVLFVIAVGANFMPRGGGQSGTPGSEQPASGQVIIFSDLDPNDAGEAGAELKDKQIPFSIVRDGTAIAVPADKADDARIKLAAKGLPKSGVLGFSQLFGDKPPGFISTDFEKQTAYKRALMGELTRLIKKIDGVDSAGVLINEPDEQLFSQDKKPTTASVMIKTLPNHQLAKDQIQGVQFLVAAAVPGLKTNNVTVVSDSGRLLSDTNSDVAGNQDEQAVTNALKQQMEMTHERETEIEGKVQSLLDKMYGPGRSVVRVAVDLDFTQKKERTRLFAPPRAKDGTTVPNYSEHSEEKSGNGAGTSGGVPGTTSNTPSSVPNYPLEQVGNSGSNQNQRSMDRTQINPMSMSMQEALMEAPVGQIKRLSVTALIQGLPAERINDLTQIVAATAGADQAGRGDVVVVKPVAFDTSQTDMLKSLIDQQDAAAKAAANNVPGKQKPGGIPLNWIIGTGAAFVVLLILLAIMRMANRREDTTDVLVNSLGDPGLPPQFDPNALAGFNGQMQGSVPMAGQMPQGPFGFLEQYDPGQVAELLLSERPATASAILGAVDPNFGDQVLAYMPEDTANDLIQRLQNGQGQMPEFQQRQVVQQLKRRMGVPV